MSQSLATDFPIDPVTTSGTALADILNRFSDSVNTSNSGATAPVDTYAGMLWLDTSVTPSIMRIRNAANTGWDTIPTSASSAFSLPDGTLAAPGLAFASEPGLGMYRASAGHINWACAGGIGLYWDFSNPAVATMQLTPRAAGQAGFSLTNSASGAANQNYLSLTQLADGSASLSMGIGGTATKKAMGFLGASKYTFDNAVTFNSGAVQQHTTVYIDKPAGAFEDSLLFTRAGVPRWRIVVDSSAEAGTNAGSNLYIQCYTDAGVVITSPIVIQRATAAVSLNGNVAVSGTFTGSGTGYFAGTLTAANQVLAASGMGFNFDGNIANYLGMGQGVTGAWCWQWNRSSGALNWLSNTGASLFGVSPVGALSCAAGIVAGGVIQPTGGPALISSADGNNYVNMQGGAGAGWAFQWSRVTGALNWCNSGGGKLFWHDGASFNTSAQAYKPGGGVWGDNSDIRIKENIVPYTTGLDAIIQLQPVTFNFKAETERDTSIRYTRLIAQDAMKAMPELVTIKHATLGTIDLDDMHELNEGPVLWALVNSVKTLDQRLAQLEHAP